MTQGTSRHFRLGYMIGALRSALQADEFETVTLIYDLLAPDLRARLVDETEPGVVRLRHDWRSS